jgi:hypothetical protein
MMRRLALAAALAPALAMLAGCPTSPCVPGTLDVRWTLRKTDGTDATCAASPAAATVRVNVSNGAATVVKTAPCTDGVVRIEGLIPGARDLTVEVFNAGGTLIYRDWLTANLDACGVTTVAAHPGRGTMRINYSTSTGQCAAPMPDATGQTVTVGGFMWYRLDDSVYGEWLSIDETSSNADKAAFECGDWGAVNPTITPMTFVLPYGVYTLKWIKEVRYPTDVPPNKVDLFRQCTAQPSKTLKSADFLEYPVTLSLVTADSASCP